MPLYFCIFAHILCLLCIFLVHMLNKCLKLVRFYKFKKDFIFANLLSKLAKEWLPPYVISK